MTTPQISDPFDLNGFLANTRWPGILDVGVRDDMPVFTGEAESTDPVVRGDALQGDKGDKGDPATPMDLQAASSDDAITSYDDLPKNLSEADAGKTWWIGNLLYRWDGKKYVQRTIGSPGPRGVMPVVTFRSLTQAGYDGQSSVSVSGSATAPSFDVSLAVPRGPAGPSGAISASLDFDGTPAGGDAPTWTPDRGKWVPSGRTLRHPKFYSVPQAAFKRVNLFQFGEITILQYRIQAQEYDWIPWIDGHVRAIGLVFSTEPFRADATVRLRTETGPAIGHGAGNITEWANIEPMFFTGTKPPGSSHRTTDPDGADVYVADTQDLSPYVVAAGESPLLFLRVGQLAGTPGKMFFDPAGAQLSVLTVPAEG